MKKVLIIFKPIPLAALSLLIVTVFLRFYLYVNSTQLIKEFKNQNFKEIYALDTLKISSRLNSLSSAINWVCLEGSVDNKLFYKMERGSCSTGFFQQKQELHIKQANNIRLIFTTKLPREVEILFSLFLVLQSILIFALIVSTRKAEQEIRQSEIRNSKLARQMSHDIRSPLATLNTLLLDTNIISENDRDLIDKSLKRINEISNSLLMKTKEVNSLKEQIQPPKLVDNNLIQIIQEIVDEKRVEYRELADVKIIVSFSRDNLKAKVEEFEFKRIISNLINNSIEARKIGSSLEILIEIKTLESNIIVSLQDNGSGIPESVLQMLGSGEYTTKKTGNGLGLLHTFESVMSWNGEITIDSKENFGTLIMISLPLIHSKEIKTILLDDDELVRLTWESFAKRKEISFKAYSNPDEFYTDINTFDLSSPIYIDSKLGNEVKGENIAIDLHERGFTELYIASGFDKESFSHLTFIKDVRDKRPPWP